MKALGILIALSLLLIGIAHAQIGITYFPGPGMPASGGGGGCASTGIFDLSNTCNDVYFIGALK